MSVQRSIILVVKRRQEERDNFSAAVPAALREYADAVERGEKRNGDLQELDCANGCRILVIAANNTVS